ncbi:MAG: ComF family protein [Rhodospirillales bacterium]
MEFALKRLLPTFGARLIDTLLPPLCLSCGAIVDQLHALCAQCWAAQSFIAPPFCQRCGTPLHTESVDEALICVACLARPPRYERARAVFCYDDASRKIVLGFKHADRTQAAPAFAAWMARAGAELIAQADVIAPVPLHYRRLWRRRYNQAALLALGIGQRSHKPVVVDLLKRLRATPSQAGLGARERRRNVARAIDINPRRSAGLQGKRVLLIDDVLTTAATVDSCVRVLRRAGVAAVDVLTLARVVRPIYLD